MSKWKKLKNIFILEINNKKYFTVDLDGIIHIVIEGTEDKELVNYLIKEMQKKLNSMAYGIMFIDTNNLTMIPYVYVVETKTLFREGSCGSGTIACAYYLNKNNDKNFNVILKEPKGNLEIKSRYDGNNILYSIGGEIEFFEEREINIDL